MVRLQAATMSIRRSDLLLLAVAVVWGSSYLAAQTLVLVGGVLAVLALRFAVSALALTPAMAVRRPSRPEIRVGLLLGLTQAAVLVLETYGVSLTSATNAGVLISLTILLTPALEGFRILHLTDIHVRPTWRRVYDDLFERIDCARYTATSSDMCFTTERSCAMKINARFISR